jgi:hypothetical protein
MIFSHCERSLLSLLSPNVFTGWPRYCCGIACAPCGRCGSPAKFLPEHSDARLSLSSVHYGCSRHQRHAGNNSEGDETNFIHNALSTDISNSKHNPTHNPNPNHNSNHNTNTKPNPLFLPLFEPNPNPESHSYSHPNLHPNPNSIPIRGRGRIRIWLLEIKAPCLFKISRTCFCSELSLLVWI